MAQLVRVYSGFCVVDEGIVESELYRVNAEHLVYPAKWEKRHSKNGVVTWEDFSIVGQKLSNVKTMAWNGTIRMKN